MNIYDFVFCFFHCSWQKRDGDGKFNGVLHVTFTIGIHLLLIYQLIEIISNVKIFSFHNFGSYGKNKLYFMAIGLIILLIIWPFYNRERTKRLLNEYHQKYREAGIKNTMKILLYVVLPTILSITLTVIRQKS